MDDRPDQSDHRSILAQLAPGTALRDGLERILNGRTGALIVLGMTPAVEAICDGGFVIDVEFSPTRLRELCKMDGAVVLDQNATRILRANVQLMPDATLPTVESGTRHRTAERVGAQVGQPVIAVSHSMSIISLYYRGTRHEVPDPSTIIGRANQALSTLERYRSRFDQVAQSLSKLEIEDQVTLREAVTAIQRVLMVHRIADELIGDVIELGSDGRLIGLQLDELLAGTEGVAELLIRDYCAVDDAEQVATAVQVLSGFTGTALLDLGAITAALGRSGESPDHQVSARGYRQLTALNRLPPLVLERLISNFSTFQALLGATAADLQTVDGIGEARARGVREGLSRLADLAISDRFS